MVERSPLTQQQLEIASLGISQYASPLKRSTQGGDGIGNWVSNEARMLYEPRFSLNQEINPLVFEWAGARQKIFVDPATIKAAIVTCGGLCPGINNVIRSLVLEMRFNYGVQQVSGDSVMVSWA